MINLCFSLQSHTFIARLKHTNSGKKASCARQNAAFMPRKSIRSTIIRYDIGFRTTLQKNNTQKTKNNMLGNARSKGKPGKIGRLPFRIAVFPLDSRLGKAQKQGQIGKNRPPTPFGCPFFHSNSGSEMLGAGANRENRSLPFRMSFFPLKSRIIG